MQTKGDAIMLRNRTLKRIDRIVLDTIMPSVAKALVMAILWRVLF